MFTYIAAWIVIDQTETISPKINTTGGCDGYDGGVSADNGASDVGANDGTRASSRVVNAHEFLINFLEANPCRDGDVFLAKLTKANPEIARRVMEVRVAYAAGDFEWDITQGLVIKGMEMANAAILKDHLAETLKNSDQEHGDTEDLGVDYE